MQRHMETRSALRWSAVNFFPIKGFGAVKIHSARTELFLRGRRLWCSRSAAGQDPGRRISQKASKKNDKQKDDDGSLGRACIRAGCCGGGCRFRAGSGAAASTSASRTSNAGTGRWPGHDGSGPPDRHAQTESEPHGRSDVAGEDNLRRQPHEDGGGALEFVAVAG